MTLEGGATVYYRVGDPGLGPSALSEEFCFHMPRHTDGQAAEFPHSLGMIADVGQTLNSTDTLNHLRVGRPCGSDCLIESSFCRMELIGPSQSLVSLGI